MTRTVDLFINIYYFSTENTRENGDFNTLGNEKEPKIKISYIILPYYVMRLCLRINACKVLVTVANVLHQ